MKRCLFFLCIVFHVQASGTTPKVPSKMSFAGMTLQITKDAKIQIQEKVNSLTKSKKHFQELLDRANLFLPIIERVIKEENLPKDFRYLVIQESALISDAVSSANAVGFWQFKEPAAREVGLKIDQHIDERMHIAAATRAAAKYLKQNNQEFNNWLYVWLFYVQHQFQGVYWSRHAEWDPVKAALKGSSYFKLPLVLEWFTGHIGLHHVHHVLPRIPNYRLQQCYDDSPLMQTVPPLSLRRSLRSFSLNLWDEQEQALVSFGSLRQSRQ